MKKLNLFLNWLKTPKGYLSAIGVLVVFWIISGFWAPRVDACDLRFGTAMEAVTGTVKVSALKEVLVKVQVPGQLSSLKPLGSNGKLPINEGEAFAQFDTKELTQEIDLYKERQRVLKAQMSIGSDHEIEIANARADLNVAETLYKSGQFSLNDLDKKRRDVSRLERSWEKEHLALERELADATYELQTRLDRCDKMTLKSPFKGELCEVYAVEGQLLAQDSPVGLIRSSELLIEVSLAEEDFPGVAVGQRATLSFTGTDQLFIGHVCSIASSGNPETHRRSAFVALDKPNDLIVPGSTGYATIIKAERKNALVVPRRALMGDTVYTIEFGYLRRHKVKVGYQNFTTVEIRDGLWPWGSVALAGTQELSDGLRVSTHTVK